RRAARDRGRPPGAHSARQPPAPRPRPSRSSSASSIRAGEARTRSTLAEHPLAPPAGATRTVAALVLRRARHHRLDRRRGLRREGRIVLGPPLAHPFPRTPPPPPPPPPPLP